MRRQAARTPQFPPVSYGIWVPGRGWLRGPRGAFADPRLKIVRTAARLYGEPVQILPIDDALAEMERTFLDLEDRRKVERRLRWLRLWRWLPRTVRQAWRI